MRVIAVNTLKEFWEKYPTCEQSLKSWLQETEKADWETPQSLKLKYRSASIITSKRVVFNINGSKYRLVVDIEFRLKIVFVVWFGNHSAYDLMDAKKVKYVKTN